jgi:cytochrome b involved in lipid metabolism
MIDIKKELFWGLGLTFIFIALSVYYFLNFQNKTIKKPAVSLSMKKETVVLTNKEVAKHNSELDCWLVIKDKVYDVTQYLNFHPGGKERIIPYCGKEATEAFLTKEGQGSHKPKAFDDLKKLFIGDFNKKK